MLSIIISWRDRVEIGQTLPTLLRAAELAGGDVTIVNFDGSTKMLESLIGAHRSQVRIIHIRQQEFFNKPAAQNCGAVSTLQPYLFFCDNDVLFEPEIPARLVQMLEARDGAFATFAGVKESEQNSRKGNHVISFGYELNIRTSDGRALKIIDHEEDTQTGLRQAPGLLLVRRRDFEAIGGYNGEHIGWGWEDQDIISRLTLGGGLERISSGEAIHLSHDDASRTAHYPFTASRWESRDRMFRRALDNYDQGRFLGTLADDRHKYFPDLSPAALSVAQFESLS